MNSGERKTNSLFLDMGKILNKKSDGWGPIQYPQFCSSTGCDVLNLGVCVAKGTDTSGAVFFVAVWEEHHTFLVDYLVTWTVFLYCCDGG